MKKSIIRRYLVLSLLFGLAMGVIFPVFASFFVTFPSADRLFWFSLCCVGAGLVVGLVSFAIGSTTLVAVIRRVSDRLEDLSSREGDLTSRLEVDSDDAVGTLVDRFHGFQDRLRAMIVSLAAVADRTQAAGQDLAANTIETSAAALQITRNAAAIQERTRVLDIDISAVEGAKEAIDTSSLKTFEAVNRQSMSLLTLASLMESNLEETLQVSGGTLDEAEAVGRTLAGSRASLEGLRQVAAASRSIQDDGKEIQELVRGIEDLAEQISILGVNAAIEAARAGTAGRGFTVVADQIRRLADLSKGNANRVAETLGRIQAKVAGSAQISQRSEADLGGLLAGMEAFTRSMGALSRTLGDHADHSRIMLQSLKDLEGVTGAVNDGTASLIEHTAEIGSALGRLRATATENQRAVQEITAGIGQIAAEVAVLQKVSQDNAATVEILGREVGRFKV